MLIGRMLAVLATLLLAALVLATPAFAEVDVTGEWHIKEDVFHSGIYQSGPDTNDYDFTIEDSLGNFAGSPYGYDDLIRGKITGSDVLFSCTNGCTGANQPDTEIYHGALQPDGTMAGISATCDQFGFPIYEGTWTAARGAVTSWPDPPNTVDQSAADGLCAQPTPPGPDLRHPTAISVQCYRGAKVTDDSTCVATVSDQGSPPETPTGGVDFTVDPANGSLPAGSSCDPLVALSATAGSPASCTVTFRPGPGGTPTGSVVPISATYQGDMDHLPSSTDHAGLTVGALPTQPTPTPGLTPPSPTLTACTAFAEPPAGVTIPPGDYTGPDGTYGTKAERAALCAQLTSLSLVLGGRWALTDSAGGALNELDLGANWVHRFQVYIELPDGWQAAAAQIHPWNASQYSAYQTAAADPPDPSFKRLASPTTPRIPKIRVAGSAGQRTTALGLNRWIAALAASRGIADAFVTTVDRADGAKQAGDAAWEGRQTRLAISLANQLAGAFARLVPLTVDLARRAAHSSLARRGLSPTLLRRTRARIARSGLTAGQRSRLRALGFDANELTALVRAARDKSVPTAQLITSPARLLADPHLLQEYRNLELYFRLWVHQPDVVASAALGL